MPTKHNKLKKKFCGICGDTAIGRNFGGMSCESCKAFFRRNAFKTIKSLKCSETNEKCVLNIENRNSCPKCRLIKCFSIGMKKELLLLSKAKECPQVMTSNFIDSESIRSDSIWDSIDSINESSNNSRLFNPNFDALFENWCLSEQQINEEIMKIEEFINGSTSFDRSQTFEKVCKQSVIPVVRPIATFNKNLNDIELSRLQELSNAVHCFEYLFTPLTPNIIEFSTLKEYYMLRVGFHNRVDFSIKQFIKYCKKLSSFKEICEDDQLSLLKSGYYYSTSWVTSTLFTDEEYFSVYFENGFSIRFSYDILKREKPNVYYLMKKYLKNTNKDLVSDSTIRNLLSAIVLFDPQRVGLVHKELVKLKQQMYLYLLQRYLIQKYGSESESMEKCSNIMNIVEESQTLTEFHIELDIDYIEFATPLLRQILNGLSI